MANLSHLSRKEQVLWVLRESGGWVDGPLLATEAVGGSEGLRRIRELKQDGWDIRMRRHPDAFRDIWQYRLAGTGKISARIRQEYQPEPAITEAVDRSNGTYTYVDPTPVLPGQLSIGVSDTNQLGDAFARPPKNPKFGELAICPRCKGKRRKAGLDSHGRPRPADEICYDPKDSTKACIRCNGFGVVPNRGPIP